MAAKKKQEVVENKPSKPIQELVKEFIVSPGKNRTRFAIEIGGSRIIHHCFSQKAMEQILAKQVGHGIARTKKKISECIEDATNRNVDGVVCIPPIAIKKSMMTACSQVKNVKATHFKQQVFIEGNSIPMTYEDMIPRIDIVRVGPQKNPDIRFRPEFVNWKARLVIAHSELIQSETVLDLITRAGQGVGLLEWRPDKIGSFGTYSILRCISDTKEYADVLHVCTPPMKSLTIPKWALDAEIDMALMAKILSSQNEVEVPVSDLSPEEKAALNLEAETEAA
jgi:hypothetical protein